MEHLIPRTLDPKASEERVVKASFEKRTLFGSGQRVEVTLRVYRVEPGLVLEDEHLPVELRRGDGLTLVKPVRRVCRYHEGPRGDPLAQKWCHATATHGSWCQRHRSSPLALYERCMASNDLEACRSVDALWPDEEYIVYMVYHGGGYKIGVTRAWRLYNRILEQPHVAAAILARVGSAREARLLEKRLAARGPGEGIGVPRRRRMEWSILRLDDPEQAARKLAEGIASLGLSGSYEAIALRVDCPQQPLLSPRGTPPAGRLRYLCSWGGVIVFEDEEGRSVGVKREALIHIEHLGRLD